jgi:hypothetical protein
LEKVLLHGVGCSGGLAALRTAANLALRHTRKVILAVRSLTRGQAAGRSIVESTGRDDTIEV